LSGAIDDLAGQKRLERQPRWQEIEFYESGGLKFLKYEESAEEGNEGGSVKVDFREGGTIEKCERWIPRPEAVNDWGQ
jgi:hypothetical protein